MSGGGHGPCRACPDPWLVSVGLGLAELVGGEGLNRWLGMPAPPALTRGYGAREIGVGVGLLTASRLAPWMWGRVAGDALDLATLGVALDPANERHDRVGGALAVVAAITVLDLLCARELSRRGL